MTRLCAIVSLLVAMLVMAWPVPLRAQAEDAIERARGLGREGVALYDQGKYGAALSKLTEADELHHAPTLVLYMARAERKLGRLMAARARYEALVAEALPADASEPFRAAKDTAYQELQELSAEIPKLLVVSSGDALTSIEIDGVALGASEAEAPMELDPGTHVVVARSGKGSVRREVELVAGSGVTRLDLNLDAAVIDDGDAGGPASDDAPDGLFIGAMIGFGVGAGGLVLGAVTGGMAASRADDIKSRCADDHCLESDAELGDEAERLALISTIGFVIGGVGAAAGIVLIAIDLGAGGEEAAVAWTPTGVRLEVRF